MIWLEHKKKFFSLSCPLTPILFVLNSLGEQMRTLYSIVIQQQQQQPLCPYINVSWKWKWLQLGKKLLVIGFFHTYLEPEKNKLFRQNLFTFSCFRRSPCSSIFMCVHVCCSGFRRKKILSVHIMMGEGMIKAFHNIKWTFPGFSSISFSYFLAFINKPFLSQKA